LPNLDAAGIGGPNGGTSFDLLTATLQKTNKKTWFYKMCFILFS